MIKIAYQLLTFLAIISSTYLLICSRSLDYISRLALLITIFIFSAFQFLILDYYFLGLTYIIVYVGAIAILFLFVIMLIQLNDFSSKSQSSYFFPFLLSIFFLSIFFLALLASLSIHLSTGSVPTFSFFHPSWSIDLFTLTDIQSLGFSIFLAYPLTLIILGILLWVVLIGILCICS